MTIELSNKKQNEKYIHAKIKCKIRNAMWISERKQKDCKNGLIDREERKLA